MERFPFIGHGPPKVTENLDLWLIARDAPDAALAAELAALLPADLKDWARDNDGSVSWHGGVLHVDSGSGVRYLVQSLDPEHLGWLPTDLEVIDGKAQISEADVERILDEVMDGARFGAKAPSPSAWDLFGAMIGEWVEAVHQRCPLWMVVVERNVKPPGTARHQEAVTWARGHLDELTARHAVLLEGSAPPPRSPSDPLSTYRWLKRSYPAVGWGAPLVRSYLADSPVNSAAKKTAKNAKPPEATRNALLELLVGSGMLGMALGSKLLGMWPKKQQPQVLARLLREGHDLGLPLLVAPASHRLLLDDEVYEAAMTPMPRLFPGDMTTQTNKRMMAPKMGDQQSEWLRRVLAVAEVDGTLRTQADAEPADQLSHKTRLRRWLELGAFLEA